MVTLAELREQPQLEGMLLLQKGTRLSITPVLKKHFDHIVKMGQ
jgi:predicted RNA-binding protein with PUA-like domain